MLIFKIIIYSNFVILSIDLLHFQLQELEMDNSKMREDLQKLRVLVSSTASRCGDTGENAPAHNEFMSKLREVY